MPCLFRCYSLTKAADQHLGILVWTEKAPAVGILAVLKDDPGNAVVAPQAFEVGRLEILPAIEGSDLVPPGFGQARKHTDHTAVFEAIGHSGPLRQSAKAMLIFAGSAHVVGVQREIGILRSMLADPQESLHPRIAGSSSG